MFQPSCKLGSPLARGYLLMWNLVLSTAFLPGLHGTQVWQVPYHRTNVWTITFLTGLESMQVRHQLAPKMSQNLVTIPQIGYILIVHSTGLTSPLPPTPSP
jgi:hypothetical protein